MVVGSYVKFYSFLLQHLVSLVSESRCLSTCLQVDLAGAFSDRPFDEFISLWRASYEVRKRARSILAHNNIFLFFLR